MNQLIAPIAIIVALIAFFVIIDRKDFYSSDAVAVQQETVTGRKPTTVTTLKPVVLPAETKPMDMKQTETKPIAETKPIVENKPAKVKQVEPLTVASSISRRFFEKD